MDQPRKTPLRSVGWRLFTLPSDRRRLREIESKIDEWIEANVPWSSADRQRPTDEEPHRGDTEVKGPSSLARTSIQLARSFRAADQDDSARRVLDEVSEILQRAARVGEREAIAPLADVLVEAGHPREAVAWYQQAIGDKEAISKSAVLVLDLPHSEAQPEGIEPETVPNDPRALIRALPDEDRAVIVQRYWWRDTPERSAEVLGISSAELKERENTALDYLEPFLGFNADFDDSTTVVGEVIGGTLTNDEKAMIQLMDSKDRARYLLQKRIHEKAETSILLSQLQSLRHQTAMSIINNIR